jgi:hypothetical protein
MDVFTLYKQYTEKAELPTALMDYLQDNNFTKQAASTKYHGSYEGGLLEHSVNVTTALLDLTERMELHWEKPRSPYLVGLMHDLCKIDSYIKTPDGFVWNRNQLRGHGDKSVYLLKEFVTDLTDEEWLCILYHMGAYMDRAYWDKLAQAQKTCPNVFWTHVADMIATRFVED